MLFCFLIYLFLVCMYKCVAATCASVYTWRPEDNFSQFSHLCGVQGLDSGCHDCVAGSFVPELSHWSDFVLGDRFLCSPGWPRTCWVAEGAMC